MSLFTLTPEQFARDLAPLRAGLVRFACHQRPCQPEEGEDLVNEAIRLALRILPEFDPSHRYNPALSLQENHASALEAWMTGILRTLIFRARCKAYEEPDLMPIAAAVELPAPPQTTPRDAIQPHIDALTKHLRDVVNDALDGYTLPEIAQRRKVSLTTVKQRIRLAKVELRLGFPDVDYHWRVFLGECSEHASYTAPGSMAEYWRNQHPSEARPRPQKRLRGAERRRQAIAAHQAKQKAIGGVKAEATGSGAVLVYTGWKGVRRAA